MRDYNAPVVLLVTHTESFYKHLNGVTELDASINSVYDYDNFKNVRLLYDRHQTILIRI